MSQNIFIYYPLRVESKDRKENPPPTHPPAPDLPSPTNPDPTGSPSPNTTGLSTSGVPSLDSDPVIHLNSHSTGPSIVVTAVPSGPPESDLSPQTNSDTMEPPLPDPTEPSSPGLPPPSANPDTMVLPNSPSTRSSILVTPVPVNPGSPSPSSGSTSELVNDCVHDLKIKPWKVQKKVVKALFVLSQTGGCRSAMQFRRLMMCIVAGEEAICLKVNEIAGMLLREPEDYWSPQSTSSSPLGDTRPCRMLGPAAALYTLSSSGTFRFAAW